MEIRFSPFEDRRSDHALKSFEVFVDVLHFL